MDNQHKKITGYRDLDQSEIDLMNDIKAEGERLEELYHQVMAKIESRGKENGTPDAELYRWAAIGKTDLQTGLMALTRAVAAPRSF